MWRAKWEKEPEWRSDLIKEKVLILEDDLFKATDVRRALQYCGIRDIHHVTNQEAGFAYIYKCQEEEPVTLVVTDMHYPLADGTVSDTEAGFKLIERFEREGIEIPIIICSSRNFREPRVLGTVWYSLLRDLNHEFYEILKRNL